ncbi:hypothetical protein ACB092_02G147900 [Castanea dentata]
MVDWNECPIDETGVIKGYEDIHSIENEFEPFVGQCFLSEEEAFIFYKNYANRNGRRNFFCHREGRQPLKMVDPSKEQQNRMSLKCGCKARLTIVLRKSIDIFPKEWHVTTFVVDHNHELLSPSSVRFIPANRVITEDDKNCILLYKEVGLSIREIIHVMKLKKNMHAVNDTMDFLQFCKVAKERNSKFQYAFTTDEEKMLEHIFWSHSHSFDWYQKYGDVVVFYTTYKVNAYDMPFGIFVGVNNHGKTILFDCALLRSETTSTFRWLMKKQPTTILTDQNPWIMEAISKELPLTKHAFCIWHITTKFSGWFTSILRNQYSNWYIEFYKLDSCEEFENQWTQVMEKYDMLTNNHVIGLYQIKHFWVPCYLRGHFFGGMTTTERSGSTNAFIKWFVSSHINLIQLIKQVDLAIEDIEQIQSHDIMLETFRGSSLRTLSPLEDQSQNVLTPYAFKNFQKEFERATQYSIHQENCIEFVLQYYKNETSQKHKVLWGGEVTNCSCKNFEFWGILCHHILSVFLHRDCYHIPPMYLSSRWCCEASLSEKELKVKDKGCHLHIKGPAPTTLAALMGKTLEQERGRTFFVFKKRKQREKEYKNCPRLTSEQLVIESLTTSNLGSKPTLYKFILFKAHWA